MTTIHSSCLLITAVLFSGCASTTGLQSTTQVVSKPVVATEARVLVNLHRLGAVSVPIPQQGTTLRRAVGDARDLASQGGNIVLTHAINALPAEDDNNAGKDGIASEDLKLFVGLECIIVARGNTWMIVPEILVTSTAMGSSRVLPGDVIQTIPYKLVNQLRESEGGTITVSSDHFDGAAVVAAGDTSLNVISDFSNWQARGLGAPPVLSPEMLRPNVVAISRSNGGTNHLLIFPCQIVDSDETPPDEFLSANSRMQNLINELKFSDGDVVHLTRLENIPTVALGLSLPVPPRATTVGPAQATNGLSHAEQLCNDSQQRISRVPGVSALQQAKQHVGTHMARLLPNPQKCQ